MRPGKCAIVAVFLALAALVTGGCYKQHLDEQNTHGLMNDAYPVAPKHPAKKIRILIWNDTISVDVLKAFQERYGIRIETTYFPDNDEAYRLLKANPENWDMVMVSQYMADHMRRDGMLQQIPRVNPFIYSYIGAYAVNQQADPQMRYFVPFDFAAMGIAFNIDYMAGFPKEWNYLTQSVDNPYLYGRIVMPDDMRYTFAAAMLYMGIDPNRATLEDLEKAKLMLIANVKHLGMRFVSFDQVEHELKNNDAILAVTWSGSAGHILKGKQECRFLIPEGKCILTMDGFCIPASCKNAETVALFIEYMLHPYVSWAIANDCMYASVNGRSMKYVDRFVVNGPSCMVPAKEDIVHMKNLSEADLAVYEKAWAEVKATTIDRDKIRIIPVN
jgi:spermidine/putrescine transport system substrate-binding protein